MQDKAEKEGNTVCIGKSGSEILQERGVYSGLFKLSYFQGA